MIEAKSDTAAEGGAMQRDRYRAMTGPERLGMAMQMSRFARSFAAAHIRSEHPDWNAEAVGRALLKAMFAPHELPAAYR